MNNTTPLALVSGASSGIGLSFARRLAAIATVAALCRQEPLSLLINNAGVAHYYGLNGVTH